MRPQEPEDVIEQRLPFVKFGEFNFDIDGQSIAKRLCRSFKHIEFGTLYIEFDYVETRAQFAGDIVDGVTRQLNLIEHIVSLSIGEQVKELSIRFVDR